MATAPLRSTDPRRVHGYRIVGRLGEGGMGVVYAARSRRGDAVALKVIRQDLHDDPTFRARFEREVAVARRVQSRATARVLAAAGGTTPFLASEFIAGPNLSEYVSASGPLLPAETNALAATLADGLVAIHAAGVVHRDLNPRNVILGADGPKIIDFGIARHDAAPTLTRDGSFIGSPMWMAPEQLSGDGASPASDVFVWGALIAYAASGRPPFVAEHPHAAAARTLYGGDVDLSAVPEPLRALVERALRRAPEERPTALEIVRETTGAEDADAIAAALDRLLGADWPRVSGIVVDWPRRSHRWRGVAVAAGAAAVVAAVVTAVIVGGSPRAHAASSYARAVLADRPVAFYEFHARAGATTYADASRNRRAARAEGVVVPGPGVLGPTDTSVYVASGTDVVTSASLTAISGDRPRVIELWFEPTGHGDGCIASIGRPGHGHLLSVCLTSGDDTRIPTFGVPGLEIATWDADVYVPVTIASNRWHYLAVSIDGRKLAIDIDGAKPLGYTSDYGRYGALATQPFTLAYRPDTSPTPLQLGGAPQANGFTGFLDEVAVYDHVPADAELARHLRLGSDSRVAAGPTIASVTPNHGLEPRHLVVTVVGSGFSVHGTATVRAVHFVTPDGHRIAADGFHVVSADRLTVVVPQLPHAFVDRALDVVVDTANGASIRGPTDEFTVAATVPALRAFRMLGTPEQPLIVLSGSGIDPAPLRSAVALTCDNLTDPAVGRDFAPHVLSFYDVTADFGAGREHDCVGLVVQHVSRTELTLAFGDEILMRATQSHPPYRVGDRYIFEVEGARLLGSIRYGP